MELFLFLAHIVYIILSKLNAIFIEHHLFNTTHLNSILHILKMGNICCGSTIVTDPIKWAKPVDEVKLEKYIVPLEMLLDLIKKEFSNPVDTVVQNLLKNERVYAANFQLKLTTFEDLYSTFLYYEIMEITNYHEHCDWYGYSQYDFRVCRYLNLIDNGIDSSIALMPKCKCVLTKKQLELYNHLVSKLY